MKSGFMSSGNNRPRPAQTDAKRAAGSHVDRTSVRVSSATSFRAEEAKESIDHSYKRRTSSVRDEETKASIDHSYKRRTSSVRGED